MKSVVLNGARSGDLKVDEVCDFLDLVLKKHGEVDVFRMRELKVADCMGCFGCWIKSPGECVIKDAARDIARKLAFADLKVYVSPVVFGGYSYELKKVLDRHIGTILPFFTKVDGEIHHPRRYDKQGSFLGVGVLPGKNEQVEAIFRELVHRNSINMDARAYSAGFVYLTDNDKEVQVKVEGFLGEVGLIGFT
jgi:multimeric flavodoxin WrbA